MTELAQAVLIAISLSPAPPTAEPIADRVCSPLLSVVATLAELRTDGLVDLWDTPQGVLLVLSPLACERLGVRVTERGGYVRSTGGKEGHRRTVRYKKADDWLDDLVDESPGPAELAEASEEIEAAGRPTREGPRPSILIGESLCPWPGPAEIAFVAQLEQPCLACGDKPLAPSAYCLVCDRWGMDRPHGGGRRRRRPCPNEGTIRPKLRAGREAAMKRRGKRCPHG